MCLPDLQYYGISLLKETLGVDLVQERRVEDGQVKLKGRRQREKGKLEMNWRGSENETNKDRRTRRERKNHRKKKRCRERAGQKTVKKGGGQREGPAADPGERVLVSPLGFLTG